MCILVSRFKNSSLKAFSLIELMVVIAIVAVLAAIAVPAYKSYSSNVKLTKIVTLLEMYADRYVELYDVKGTSPDVRKLETVVCNYSSTYNQADLIGSGCNTALGDKFGISSLTSHAWNTSTTLSQVFFAYPINGLTGDPDIDGKRIYLRVGVELGANGEAKFVCGTWSESDAGRTYDIKISKLPSGCNNSSVSSPVGW
jgi:type IV pilus assembly protein PilA